MQAPNIRYVINIRRRFGISKSTVISELNKNVGRSNSVLSVLIPVVPFGSRYTPVR